MSATKTKSLLEQGGLRVSAGGCAAVVVVGFVAEAGWSAAQAGAPASAATAKAPPTIRVPVLLLFFMTFLTGRGMGRAFLVIPFRVLVRETR
ncbi:hypothetical protein DV20_29255 [Amycolatopsis rifamycinica]|uniref:Uncharacterized protein n=1 Tax=Amycolatopsis rifamycinica TaxID=287986 RepID=A0A066U3C2_9PSEU|nr:hypothetical protein DV20_29255 [Amycolatopsis rifamycinica]